MTAKNIEKYKKLRPEGLDHNNYTVSLLNEGLRVGLIDQVGLDAVLARIMAILAELINKYTHGQSSSLKVETSQRLLLSIFYALDHVVKIIPDPVDALHLLAADEIGEIYKKGLEQLEASVAEGRLLYQQIADHKLPINIVAYHATIDQALPEFFLYYDLRFSARDTSASIDYPLLFDDMKIQGIDYIKQYLQTLLLENEFCHLFPLADINQLLFHYGRVYQIDYSEALINVFEIVLTNAIFSILAGSGAQLNISPLQLELLRERFASMDTGQTSALITTAIETLCSDLTIDDSRTRQYISKFQSILVSRLLNALAHDCLENVVILNQTVKQPLELAFYEGQHLDDEAFRLLVEQIIECSQAEEKTVLVSANIHSLGDFIDILEAECFFDEEYGTLFNSLGDIELSILARIVFIEELRSNPQHFSLANPQRSEMEMQMEWQIEFDKFLQTLSPDRIQSIQTHLF
jgi:hypothetical protein